MKKGVPHLKCDDQKRLPGDGYYVQDFQSIGIPQDGHPVPTGTSVENAKGARDLPGKHQTD